MLDVSSSAFGPDHPIPSKYTCDGDGVSPPLAWSTPPKETQSVAILVDDPDAPSGSFLHWLVTDIPPEMSSLDEGAAMPRDSSVVENDAGNISYYGPCPPSGTHHYHFHVYALDTTLGRPENRDEFLAAIKGHIVDEGEVVAVYQHQTS